LRIRVHQPGVQICGRVAVRIEREL